TIARAWSSLSEARSPSSVGAITASPLVAALTSAAQITSASGSTATWALPVGHPPVNRETLASCLAPPQQRTRQPAAGVNGGPNGPSRRTGAQRRPLPPAKGWGSLIWEEPRVTSHGRHLPFGHAGDDEGSRVRTPSLTLVLGSSGFRRRDG